MSTELGCTELGSGLITIVLIFLFYRISWRDLKSIILKVNFSSMEIKVNGS
jgi:hypothetical protein